MRCSINSSGDRPLMAPALLNPAAEGEEGRRTEGVGYEGGQPPIQSHGQLSKASSSSRVKSFKSNIKNSAKYKSG